MVTAGLMLAVGILLPFVFHSLAIPGNVFLPMHIPVFLSSFLSGAVYGAACGFLLPYLNSVLTGMPVLYPTAVIMSLELLCYGAVCGILHRLTGYSVKLRHLYLSLVPAMISGRVVYGITGAALMLVSPSLRGISAILALVNGIPGIIIQLILVPQLIMALGKGIRRSSSRTAINRARDMIRRGKASCVTVRDGKIRSAVTTRGIAHIMSLYEAGELKDAFVADTLVGKAAAMIFTAAGVREIYALTASRAGISWCKSHGVKIRYLRETKFIVNRRCDGMCPMECVVRDISDAQLGILLLQTKITELSRKQ